MQYDSTCIYVFIYIEVIHTDVCVSAHTDTCNQENKNTRKELSLRTEFRKELRKI